MVLKSDELRQAQKMGKFVYQFDDQSYLAHPLDTDNDNFGVVYGCKPGSGDELIFILSRDYTLSREPLKRARDALQRNGIDSW